MCVSRGERNGAYHGNHFSSLTLVGTDCLASMLELLAKLLYLGVMLGMAFHEHLLRVVARRRMKSGVQCGQKT